MTPTQDRLLEQLFEELPADAILERLILRSGGEGTLLQRLQVQQLELLRVGRIWLGRERYQALVDTGAEAIAHAAADLAFSEGHL